MQQPGRSLAAILVSLVLCGAFRSEAAQPSDEAIARGKALVVAGDCAGCHTSDPAKPFAGGSQIATPFGGIYPPNLTPDNETGLGNWRDEDFLRRLLALKLRLKELRPHPLARGRRGAHRIGLQGSPQHSDGLDHAFTPGGHRRIQRINARR